MELAGKDLATVISEGQRRGERRFAGGMSFRAIGIFSMTGDNLTILNQFTFQNNDNTF